MNRSSSTSVGALCALTIALLAGCGSHAAPAALSDATQASAQQDPIDRADFADTRADEDQSASGSDDARDSAPQPAAAPATEAAVPSHAAGRQLAPVNDWERQMTAALIDIPAGWDFAGVVARAAGCRNNGAGIKFTAQSRDGALAVEMLPTMVWSYWVANDGANQRMAATGCEPIGAASADEFLRYVVLPQMRPHAQLLSMDDPPPELVAVYSEQLARMREENARMAASYGQPPQLLSHEGKRARIRYQRDGQMVEEQISVLVDCIHPQRMGPMQRLLCTSGPLTILRAPAQRLDASLPQLTGVAVRFNLKWLDAVARQNKQASDAAIRYENMMTQQIIANLNMAGAVRTAIHEQNEAARAASVDASIRESQAAQAAMDRSSHDFARSLLGQAAYVNPQTGQRVIASNQYKYSYVTPDGSTVVQTDDPRDPNRSGAFSAPLSELILDQPH
jgi:hypothetical protein